MDYRVTIGGENGTVYSYVVNDGDLTIGDWVTPFDSEAGEFIASLYTSNSIPQIFLSEKVTMLTIEENMDEFLDIDDDYEDEEDDEGEEN
jgi:hypothetical protein